MVTQQKKRTGPRQAQSMVSEAMAQPTEMIKEYPVSSILVVFGVGLGVGVVLSQALIPSFHEPTMSERMSRQLYDSMHHLSNSLGRGFQNLHG